MDFDNITELQIDGKAVAELYIDGKLAWQSTPPDPRITILKFNAGNGIKTFNVAKIEKIPEAEYITIDLGAD